jgi:hypothetical protein
MFLHSFAGTVILALLLFQLRIVTVATGQGGVVMTVQLEIEYEKLVGLVDQLAYDQQKDLIVRLLTRRAYTRSLSAEEKRQLLNHRRRKLKRIIRPGENAWRGRA